MNKDMCVRCDEGVINIRVGAIIIKGNKVLMVKNNKDNVNQYNIMGSLK